MLLCADADAASADLASGALACPSCGAGRLRSWGYGRERVIRASGGEPRGLRPRRGRCRSCGATHVLLPSWSAPRRADSVGVIARAAAASVLHGTGTARLGAELGVPAATVRGLAAPPPRPGRADCSRRRRPSSAASSPSSRPPRAAIPARRGRPGSVLGDALALVAACAHRRDQLARPGEADFDALLGRFGLAAAARARARKLIPKPGPGHPHARDQPATLTVSSLASSAARVAATVSIPATSRASPRLLRARNARF